MDRRRKQAVDAARALERWGYGRDWFGTDPYDALNAHRFASVLRRTPTGRRVLTQVVKRSPANLRPVLGVPPGRSAAALASVASAYARGGFTPADESLTRLRAALEALWESRSTGFVEPCWGYHFDVQTRVFFYPSGAPNTIATAFAGHAWLDGYERAGEQRWLDVAAGTAEFFRTHVPGTTTAEGVFYGYLVGDRTPIHNANMLVCGLFARLAGKLDRPDLADLASAGVRYTLAHQRPDGSWPYGERAHLDWVDNFHTGYVLEALMRCRAAGLGDERLDVALARGLSFYRRELFTADGKPKYFASSLYPIDIQCVAQGIQTFALASHLDASYVESAWRVAQFGLSAMRRSDGAFVFQRRRMWTNRTPHIRWCEAPMLLALTHLLALAEE